MTHARRAANDPSTDRVVAFALRYMRPLAIAGTLATLFVIGWVLSL